MVHTKENKSGVFLNHSLKELIRGKFEKINNVDEFVSLLNYIDIHIHNPEKEIHLLTSRHLYFLSISKNTRYKTFYLRKKNGKQRIINSPDKLLKRVQNLINILLQIIFENFSHNCCNGFLIGKDIVRNALPHVNKRYVLNIDLKDFFPSINFRRIKTVVELPPFNLKNQREEIGFLISNISTYENFLPQGAPTSPILSNIVTQTLDSKIYKVCFHKKIKYSRYADDLTFSCNNNILNDKFLLAIGKIIKEENFVVNEEKTRIRSSMDRQEVTGLVVNTKVNVKRKYLQKVRAMLNNWDKGGLQFAEERFKLHQPPHQVDFDFKAVLLGHLAFIKLVKGDENHVAKKMRLKYSLLNNLIDYSFIDNEAVKKRLRNDNLKMETIFFETANNDDKFISYCTSAFHQIENLINYYYWKKFPEYDDLLDELILKNESFGKKFKTKEKAKESFSKISKLNINVLVYLYEREFFFDENIYYDKHLTILREIRNDDSHRCSVIDIDIEKLKNDYEIIRTQVKDKIRRNKNPQLTPAETRIKLNYKTQIFLEEKKYKDVRISLRNLANNINKSLKKGIVL